MKDAFLNPLFLHIWPNNHLHFFPACEWWILIGWELKMEAGSPRSPLLPRSARFNIHSHGEIFLWKLTSQLWRMERRAGGGQERNSRRWSPCSEQIGGNRWFWFQMFASVWLGVGGEHVLCLVEPPPPPPPLSETRNTKPPEAQLRPHQFDFQH